MLPPAQFTKVLLAILLIVGCLELFAWSRMQSAIDDASAQAQDLADVRSDLTDLNNWHVANPSQTASLTAPLANGDNQFNQHLQAAAEEAQIKDQIASIEPGPPARLHDSDFTETPVFVRLNSITLRQLVKFLYQLSANDRSLRTKMIELSIPDAAPPGNQKENAAELWTADLTLNNLAFSPKSRDTR